MGSQHRGQLAVLGGQPAYQEHPPEDEPSAHDALRALMPGPAEVAIFDFSRGLGEGLAKLVNVRLAEIIDELIGFMVFLGQHQTLPFSLAIVEPKGTSRELEAELHYYPEVTWKGLPPQAVVRLLAIEVGLDPADVGLDSERSEWSDHPARGILRIPAEFLHGPVPFALIQRALLKLSDAYHDEPTHARLVEWASQLER